MPTITHAGLSDRGRVRPQNEDRWFADPAQGLYIVADGMGGRVAGGLAAQVVVETLPLLLRNQLTGLPNLAVPQAGARVRAAVAELSDRLRRESEGQLGLEGMGSTVVLALVHDAQALIAHLGDSRGYLYRDGHLKQLTRDHSLIQLLLDCGEITHEEAIDHPARGQLTRYVGMEGEALSETHLLELQPGDRLLLCSDGLTDMLSKGEMCSILAENLSPAAACRSLVSAANGAGGKDNITALVVSLCGSET
jgi:protein phosphatase